jgi:hypothetical protein
VKKDKNERIKAQQSLHRLGQRLRVPEFLSCQVSRKSAHGCGKFVNPTHLRPSPQEIRPVLVSVGERVDPRTIVPPERL